MNSQQSVKEQIAILEKDLAKHETLIERQKQVINSLKALLKNESNPVKQVTHNKNITIKDKKLRAITGTKQFLSRARCAEQKAASLLVTRPINESGVKKRGAIVKTLEFCREQIPRFPLKQINQPLTNALNNDPSDDMKLQTALFAINAFDHIGSSNFTGKKSSCNTVSITDTKVANKVTPDTSFDSDQQSNSSSCNTVSTNSFVIEDDGSEQQKQNKVAFKKSGNSINNNNNNIDSISTVKVASKDAKSKASCKVQRGGETINGLSSSKQVEEEEEWKEEVRSEMPLAKKIKLNSTNNTVSNTVHNNKLNTITTPAAVAVTAACNQNKASTNSSISTATVIAIFAGGNIDKILQYCDGLDKMTDRLLAIKLLMNTVKGMLLKTFLNDNDGRGRIILYQWLVDCSNEDINSNNDSDNDIMTAADMEGSILLPLIDFILTLLHQSAWSVEEIGEYKLDKLLKKIYKRYSSDKSDAQKVKLSLKVKEMWPQYRIMRRQFEINNNASSAVDEDGEE